MEFKPGNLLVNSNCVLKICDFGLARWVGKTKKNVLMNSVTILSWKSDNEIISAGKFCFKFQHQNSSVIIAKVIVSHSRNSRISPARLQQGPGWVFVKTLRPFDVTFSLIATKAGAMAILNWFLIIASIKLATLPCFVVFLQQIQPLCIIW